MSFFVERDFATMFLDGATIILLLIVMIMSAEDRKRGREDDKRFFLYLIVNIIMAVGDTIAYIFEFKQPVAMSTTISTIGMTIFYFCFILVVMVWMDYCRIRFKEKGASSGSSFRLEHIPGIVMLAMVLINVFTGWIFRYDRVTGDYIRGFMFIVVYIVFAFYAISGFVHLGKYRSRKSSTQLIPMYVFVLPIVFGFVFTFAVKGSASFAPIGLAMAVTFTYIGTINEFLNISYKK